VRTVTVELLGDYGCVRLGAFREILLYRTDLEQIPTALETALREEEEQ